MVVVHSQGQPGDSNRSGAIAAWKRYMERDPAGDYERSTLAIDSAIDSLYGREDQSAHGNPRTGMAGPRILDYND